MNIAARLEAWKLKFWAWMSNSGTILWARLQVLGNAILGVLVMTDVSALGIFNSHPEYLVYWNIVSGVIAELIRKNNTITEMGSVYVPDYGRVETATLLPKEK